MSQGTQKNIMRGLRDRPGAKITMVDRDPDVWDRVEVAKSSGQLLKMNEGRRHGGSLLAKSDNEAGSIERRISDTR